MAAGPSGATAQRRAPSGRGGRASSTRTGGRAKVPARQQQGRCQAACSRLTGRLRCRWPPCLNRRQSCGSGPEEQHGRGFLAARSGGKPHWPGAALALPGEAAGAGPVLQLTGYASIVLYCPTRYSCRGGCKRGAGPAGIRAARHLGGILGGVERKGVEQSRAEQSRNEPHGRSGVQRRRRPGDQAPASPALRGYELSCGR